MNDGAGNPSGKTGGQRFIRRVNDSIFEVLLKLEVEDGEFWCECTDVDCNERVLLTLREYRTLRQGVESLLSRAHRRARPAGRHRAGLTAA